MASGLDRLPAEPVRYAVLRGRGGVLIWRRFFDASSGSRVSPAA